MSGGLLTLSRWSARLTVTDAPSGLAEFLAALLVPYFPGGDPGGPAVSVHVTPALSVPHADLEAVPRSPQLWIDENGPRLVVLEHRPGRVVAFRDMERDSDPALVTADHEAGTVRIDVGADTPGTRRAVVRLLTFFLAAQLHASGVPVLHGSAVARGGRSVAILGPSGSGKSTLAFLASTLAGWDFVSDDSLLVWRERPGGPPVVSGAPKRLGIGVGSLTGHPARERFETHPLRRYGDAPIGTLPTPSDSWSREGRVRLYCDIDEFTAVTGAGVDQGSAPAALLLPTADPQLRGWRITRAEDGDLPELEPTGGRDLRHSVDYLGMLAPRAADPLTRESVLTELRKLPRFRVRYGPDVNADFPRFWAEVTEALGVS